MLRRIFGPQRDEVTGEWRRLNNEKLNDLYYTKYYLGDQIKKNEMGRACSTYDGIWGGGAYQNVVGRQERRNHLEDPGVDGRIILRWIFRKWDYGLD